MQLKLKFNHANVYKNYNDTYATKHYQYFTLTSLLFNENKASIKLILINTIYFTKYNLFII